MCWSIYIFWISRLWWSTGVSDTIFVSDLNDLPYEALSSTSSTDYALGMTVSRSSALSMNVLLIFYIADKDGALFLNAAFFSTLWFSFAIAGIQNGHLTNWKIGDIFLKNASFDVQFPRWRSVASQVLVSFSHYLS